MSLQYIGLLVGSGGSNTATGQERLVFPFILRKAFGTVIPGNFVTHSKLLSWCTEIKKIKQIKIINFRNNLGNKIG